MSALASIFTDFNLPNATTWFYFSLLLAVALFFKFTRLLSLRNWDVVTLFLLVPGLLIVQEAHTRRALTAARVLAASSQALLGGGSGVGNATAVTGSLVPFEMPAERLLWFGFLWLLCGSAYFLTRCLVDLALVRRPALGPNLNLSGLIWLGAALFICLSTVALRKAAEPPEMVGKRSPAVKELPRLPEDIFNPEMAARELGGRNSAFWVEYCSAIFCHLAIVFGLGFIGAWHFQDIQLGVAAAAFYLLLPYTAYHVGQVHHVLPSALLIWAVAAYRRPGLAGVLFGLAAGTGYFPVLMLPVWVGFYWRRGATRFLGGFALAAALCLAVIADILWMDGDLARSISSTLMLSDWQPWIQPDPRLTEGFWTGVEGTWAYRMPVFIAYLAFVVATLFWPAPKNLAHLIALLAASGIGIQFWFADQGGVYVLWYLPLLLLLVFRPNLADRLAVPPPEMDLIVRARRLLGRVTARLFKLPETTVRV